jgi:hypothetical protein
MRNREGIHNAGEEGRQLGMRCRVSVDDPNVPEPRKYKYNPSSVLLNPHPRFPLGFPSPLFPPPPPSGLSTTARMVSHSFSFSVVSCSGLIVVK